MNETTEQPIIENSLPSTTEKVWKFPQRNRTLRLRPKEVMPVTPTPTERETRLKEKYGIEQQTGLMERGVRFDYEDGPAWAVEAYIPLSEILRDRLNFGLKIEIPEKITGITYLDLSPQESTFPAKFRNITTDWQSKTRPTVDLFGLGRPLDKLRIASTPDALSDFFAFLASLNMGVSKDDKKAAVFIDMLQGTFLLKEEAQRKFNEILAKAAGADLLIVHGHGGGDPHHMGERWPHTVMSGDYVAQRAGNKIMTKDVIDKYNDPKTFAVMILHACNLHKADITAKDVPLIYPKGPTMFGDSPYPWHQNQTYISEARKK